MRFHIIFIAAVLCASCVGAATASQPLSTAGTKRASVRVLDCDRAGQEALFRAAMRRIAGTRRMAIRFTLLERDPGDRFRRIRAPGLTRWKKSRAGVRRFAHRQRVRGLSNGSDYRVRVDYRWLDGDGRVIRGRRLDSRTCSLAVLPNLKVSGIESTPEGAGSRYAIGVENAGEAHSPETSVRLGVDGNHQGFATVPPLAPGESAAVSVSGQRCLLRVRAVVDPALSVRESSEGDNVLAHGCP